MDLFAGEGQFHAPTVPGRPFLAACWALRLRGVLPLSRRMGGFRFLAGRLSRRTGLGLRSGGLAPLGLGGLA